MHEKRTRPPTRARSGAESVWRERAGLALTLAVVTLFWFILASDAQALDWGIGERRARSIEDSPSMTHALAKIAVPEPDTAIMTGLGLAGLAWASRRQARHDRTDAG